MNRNTLALLLLLPAPVLAQSVHGTAIDASTNAPVSVVNVTLMTPAGKTLYSVVGDSTGEFSMPTPSGMGLVMVVRRIGYAPAQSTVFTLKYGQLLDVEVVLAPRAIELDPMKVVATRRVDPRLSEFYDRATLNKKLGLGRLWTRADLEKQAGVPVSHLLHTVSARPDLGCNGSETYIDRLRLFDDTDIDLMVATEDMEGLEVYRSPEIPSGYDPQLCRLTLIWRKPYGESGRHLTWSGAAVAASLIAAVFLENLLFWKR